MSSDLDGGQLTVDDWKGADSISALTQAYELVDRAGDAGERWYFSRKKWHGRAAKGLRFFSLLFFGLGGLVPLARGILEVPPALHGVPWSELGYLALAAGAALLAFDYFFGFSGTYTRFVTTGLTIRNARMRFHAEWLALVSEAGGIRPGVDVHPFFACLREFQSTVAQLVDRETLEWVTYFRSSLAEMQRLASRTPRHHPDDAEILPPPGAGRAAPGRADQALTEPARIPLTK